ncbi:MAG: ATP synthase F1 subunit delta [Myxococcota bacterium]|jgi:F-type H+-transporting ATPase subunit delta|nr:ATP synthase F1 subunit delta [Myxococcota bacterium]
MSRRAELQRYARLLVQQGQAERLLGPLREGLTRWAEALRTTPDLPVALGNPALPLPRRLAMIDEVGRHLQVPEVTQRVIRFLVEGGRLGALEELRRALDHEVDRLEGWVRVTVRSARPLGPRREKQLVAALRARLDREVILEPEVDPGLLGGIFVTVDDLTFDGSLRNRLRRLGEHLAAQARQDVAERG